MTDKQIIALCIENDMLIMRALACLTEENTLPSITEKLRSRSARLAKLMDAHLDGARPPYDYSR